MALDEGAVGVLHEMVETSLLVLTLRKLPAINSGLDSRFASGRCSPRECGVPECECSGSGTQSSSGGTSPSKPPLSPLPSSKGSLSAGTFSVVSVATLFPPGTPRSFFVNNSN